MLVRLRNQLSDTLWTRKINADCSARVVCTFCFLVYVFETAMQDKQVAYLLFVHEITAKNRILVNDKKQIENEKDIYFLI